MYHIFLVHSPAGKPVGFFRVLVVVNSAALFYTEVPVSFQAMLSSGYTPRSGDTRSYGNFYF